ncbi:MAG: hypothetical protein ACKV2Q_06245 [Planctomycetaceae bacterium]
MSRPRSTNRLCVSTVCRAALLTVAATMLWMLALVFVGSIAAEFFHERQTEYQQHQFTFRKDGLPVWKTRSVREGEYDRTEYHDLDGKLIEMSEKDESSRLVAFVDSRLWKRPLRATWRSDVVRVSSSTRVECYFEDLGTRGQFTLFDSRSKQRIGWIGQQGFSTLPLSEEQQFPTRSGSERAGFVGVGDAGATSQGWATASYYQPIHEHTLKLLIEPGGRRVHWIDLRERSSRLIHDGEPIWAASFDWPVDPKTEAVRVVLRTADSLLVVLPTATSLPAASAVPLTVTSPAASALPLTSVVETLRLPDRVRRSALLQWERTVDGPLFVEPLFADGWKLTWATPAGTVIRERIVRQRDLSAGGEGIWFLPLIQFPAFGDFLMWAMTHPEDSESSSLDHRRARQLGLELPRVRPEMDWKAMALPLEALHVSVMLWSVLAVRRLRRFGSSVGEQLFWGAWMLAFGVPGYLAFRVHRTWPASSRSHAPRGNASSDALRSESASLRPQVTMARDAERRDLRSHAERGNEIVLALLSRVDLSPGHAALVVKELRSTAIIGAAACGAYLLVVAKLTSVTGFGWMRNFVSENVTQIPFLDEAFEKPYSVVSMLLAVCLAVWQTANESRGGAWLYLLHKPVSRRAIVLSKLAAGLSVLLICSALPIVLYGAWAARPGTHPSPFEWSMTHETWRLWWSLPPLYLGTLLTLLRPARWFGTRLLPCVAGFGWMVYRESLGAWLWPMWQEFGVVAAIDVVFAMCLLLVVREREYP